MVTYVEMKTGLLCEITFEAALHKVPGIWGPRRGPGLLTSLFFLMFAETVLNMLKLIRMLPFRWDSFEKRPGRGSFRSASQ